MLLQFTTFDCGVLERVEIREVYEHWINGRGHFGVEQSNTNTFATTFPAVQQVDAMLSFSND